MMSATFTERAKTAVQDIPFRDALAIATTRFADGRVAKMGELPDPDGLRDRGRAIRRATLENLDQHLANLADAVEAAGGHVHWALDGDEACQIIADIARQHDVELAVKSKSMTSEEIELNHVLEAQSITVVETDLGEWIVQLAGERPSHIIAPAVHKTIEDVIELFEKATGEKDLPAEIPALTAVARRTLRERFIRAGIGISGVNFAIAETGTIVIVTNEGNGRFITSLPPVHVAIMGVDKVVRTWNDWAILLPLLTRSATGQRLSSYVTAVTGPRRAGDVDGPQEFHLVIMDNGRSEILDSRFRESLACIRCGACMNVCPVYAEVGGHAYGSVYPGPIGAVITPLFQGLDEPSELPWASTLCGACLDACPVRIDLPRMLIELRQEHVERGLVGRGERLAFRWFGWLVRWRFLFDLAAWMGWLVQRPFARNGRVTSAPPPLSAWTRYRDWPALADRSFNRRWKDLERET
ncbi:MAG: LutB/LldF family L-lactate oxidation iron-sulfur protein [Anaerolineae bacterium]